VPLSKGTSILISTPSHNKEKFNTNDCGAPKSAGPVAIATFATIVNPALTITLALLAGKFFC